MAPRQTPRRRAVVIGASTAGMLAARVCRDHFDDVVLHDRDELDLEQQGSRRGIGQARHPHLLLSSGLRKMEGWFPGLTSMLVAEGGIASDLGQLLRWHAEDGHRPRIQSGLTTVSSSRALLDNVLRRELGRFGNVRFRGADPVLELLWSEDGSSVEGVRTPSGESWADLVVDCTGAAARTTGWLADYGYEPPPCEQIEIGVRYTSCLVDRTPAMNRFLLIGARPPDDGRAGLLQPIEDGLAVAMVQSRGEHPAPRTHAEFREFAAGLASPELAMLLADAGPRSDLAHYQVKHTQLHHYERLHRFPRGLVVLGDALCRLNPVYGQGMSSAAAQAQALERWLPRSHVGGAWKQLFGDLARVVADPWNITVAEDAKFPSTRGAHPKFPRVVLDYMSRLGRVVNSDPTVYRAFLRVLNLEASPRSLLRPSVVWRVLTAQRPASLPSPFAALEGCAPPRPSHSGVQLALESP